MEKELTETGWQKRHKAQQCGYRTLTRGKRKLELFYSYRTCVAFRLTTDGAIDDRAIDSHKYSITTTKHKKEAWKEFGTNTPMIPHGEFCDKLAAILLTFEYRATPEADFTTRAPRINGQHGPTNYAY